MYGQLDGWDLAETPEASFVVRPTKPRSPHLRRHVFLFATVLILFIASAFIVTRWVMPASRVSRPWLIKTTKPCSRAILGKDLVTDEYGMYLFHAPLYIILLPIGLRSAIRGDYADFDPANQNSGPLSLRLITDASIAWKF